ncbi:hypothetical protein ACFW04_014010 [Cataglyphis niger]
MIIQALPSSGSKFFNYKKSFSVVLLALVDAYYKFIIVDPHIIVGDETFPLKTYLMRPHPGKQLDDNEKRIYNYRLCRTRKVENAFGSLTQKFRIYQRRLQSKC